MPEKSKPDPARLRDKALAYLARREHSRFELTRKLERAGFDLDDINPVLDELEEKEWLSDMRFAESYVAAHSGKWGSTKLIHELKARGVESTLISVVVPRDGTHELQYARRIWKKRFESIPIDAHEWANQYRFLQTRGFSASVIRLVLQPDDEQPIEAGHL